MWQNWVNAVLGLWVALTPFLGFAGALATWNLVVVGLVVAVLGFWGATQK